MDVIDNKIISVLQTNSKISLSELSDLVHLSSPSVRERINKLLETGIIKKYTIDIDYTLLGYTIEVIMHITIKNNLYKDFKLFINNQSDVDFCYRVSGSSCFLVKMHFQSMSAVEQCIDDMQSYGHTHTQFILSQVK
ncbi:Lrp/AsnC family transcriptional regulator [Staphylococcus arlettae]|uniref:Lrp/AsnC family transcriptional regulator n=1 Tax=Staphylococcus arlettae TaxID=29378 RepID=UPI001E46DE1D|nr:Lrp/AsnC family transcriptional regulator [Staphylococcus arlettae]MCD8842268.1 Lrp/AsnC family transcriptional regulator [Staphylococcus arlettae]